MISGKMGGGVSSILRMMFVEEISNPKEIQ